MVRTCPKDSEDESKYMPNPHFSFTPSLSMASCSAPAKGQRNLSSDSTAAQRLCQETPTEFLDVENQSAVD